MEKEEFEAVFMAKARDALDSAWLEAEHDHAAAAFNRAYYAAYYVAKAALYRKGELPRTHKDVRTRFLYHFEREGVIDSHIADALKQAEVARYRADYGAFTIYDTNAAVDLIRDVERFVEVVQGLLDSGEI